MFFPIFKNTTPAVRAFTFAMLYVLGMIFSVVIVSAIYLLWDVNIEANQIRVTQACTQLCQAVFPPLIFAMLVKAKPFNYLGFNKIPLWSLLGIVAMFTVIPFTTFLTNWNAGFTLPDFMAGIEKILHNLEDNNVTLTRQMLDFKTIGGLFVGLIIVALLAAVGEELLFRSVLQPFFIRICKRPWIGILVTALVFSACHLDFFNFISRFVLGFMLGYMYYLSGSIWVPMLMHFLNNALIVVLYYLNHNNIVAVDVDNLGACGAFGTILSAVVTIAIFVACYRLSKRTQKAL